jgi:YggT family protein
MLIIGRIYLFLNWLVVSGIMFVILLIILRWIANAADLNPFAWTARTIRRLTDPMIQPVRRGLMNFGVDPKYSPIVTILLAVLLGWFVLQLLGSLANTLIGVLISAQNGTAVPLIGYLLYGALGLYSLLIFVRIILSWGMMGYGNRLMRFLINVTEPLLAPLRRIIPPLGMFDISPIIAFIIIWLFQAAIAGTLLGNLPRQFLG